MENNQIYNQGEPMGQMMPPQRPMPIWQRMVNSARKVQNVYPKWLAQYSIAVYLVALAIVSFMYSAYSLPWYYMLSGVVAVTVFFLYGSTAAQKTSIVRIRKEKAFEKKLFLIAFIPRITFMILLYWIFQENYGDAFGFENSDATFYDDLGKDFAIALSDGNFISFFSKTSDIYEFDDIGYATYVGFIYWLTGNSIIILRLIKCILSSITVLLICRVAKRNFGEETGRMAAIFAALWPNFWYYCAVHLKETEMVFLAVLFVEQAEQMLRSRNFTAWKVIPILLIAASLFTLRTPLALIALLSLVFSLVMSSSKVVSWGKRIAVGGLAILLIILTMGNRISEEARGLVNTVQSDEQQDNMSWRSERKDGNSFAKYAGATVFAPMIFTIPFPSMVRPYDGQDEQQILNGGNFVKNIMSGCTILAMFTLLLSGKWRDHLLPLSFMLGYLVVLTMSTFAQSERFHQPAMPFELMFMAYGVSVAVTKRKYKRWFMYWCCLMFVACVAWNWFKLAGRGLV